MFGLNWKKVGWLIGMGLMCIALIAVVSARIDVATNFPDNIDPDAVKEEKPMLSTPTPAPIQDEWPDIDITLPQYAMVNSTKLLASSYVPDVSKIEGTYNMMFDTAALPYLEALMQDLRDNGFGVYIGGAYRSYSYQKQRFDGKCYNIALEMGIEGFHLLLGSHVAVKQNDATDVVLVQHEKTVLRYIRPMDADHDHLPDFLLEGHGSEKGIGLFLQTDP